MAQTTCPHCNKTWCHDPRVDFGTCPNCNKDLPASPHVLNDLLPCPFCGCEDIDMWPMDGFESPVCNGCGATICENYSTGKDTAEQIKAWNTRPDNYTII